ncbi:MAG: polysaccharide deacetylase family protein [Meiothermus sp.]|nr:polysaccharide deacetylase family protein [Meiothermus sp.]
MRPHSLTSYSTHTEVFERHLAWLAEHCEVVDFTEALRPAGRRPRVSITFDDGYLDNVQFAVPLLEAYGLEATFFVTTGFIERDPTALAWVQQTYGMSLEQIQPLDKVALSELFSVGMPVGAHAHTHRRLRDLSVSEQRDELERSKALLEQHLGVEIQTMAYPFGLPAVAFDRRTVGIARGLGYRQVGAVQYRGVRPSDDPLRIPRFVLTNETERELEAIVYGGLDLMGMQYDLRYALSR